MSVITENLLCFLGLAMCALPGAAGNAGLIRGIFVIFCLAQIPIFEMAYKKLRVRQILAYESVYLMTNFLFALVFRLVMRAAAPIEKLGPNTAFMFFLVFNAVHWIYAAVRLTVKRVKDGPEPKKHVRYGIIQDSEIEEGL